MGPTAPCPRHLIAFENRRARRPHKKNEEVQHTHRTAYAPSPDTRTGAADGYGGRNSRYTHKARGRLGPWPDPPALAILRPPPSVSSSSTRLGVSACRTTSSPRCWSMLVLTRLREVCRCLVMSSTSISNPIAAIFSLSGITSASTMPTSTGNGDQLRSPSVSIGDRLILTLSGFPQFVWFARR
ncbi:hypothetical protein FB004_103242 [Sinorhizobium medicae]|nr:hypothetical protein FB004_103242 [Sinorhizobium medicae]